MKICSDCKIEKKLELFNYDKSRDRYLSVCKPCASVRTEEYRQKNKHKWRENDAKHSQKVKELILEWKSQGCAKCNDKRHYVLDAHHIDPTTKDFSIGSTKRGYKITEKELTKCLALCSNCHREYHHLEKEQDITLQEYIDA